MSDNWVKDIADMHAKFGVNEWMAKKLAEGDYAALRTFMKFRIDFLREELNETEKAYDTLDAEEIVDGLIDLCIVAIGTLDAFGVDAHKAWDAVHTANMTKEPGVKPSRPNKLGLPDLIKPIGWEAPDHSNNHGIISKIK